MAVDYDELSMKKITGTAKFEVDRAYLLLEVTQSNQVDADGLQHQVQVYPDDCNINVYFCVRQQERDVGMIVADAEVTISVQEQGTGKLILKRTGKVAKPSGDSFRDYMTVFNRPVLREVEKKQTGSTVICFVCEYSVRLVRIGFGDPDVPVVRLTAGEVHPHPQRIPQITGLQLGESDVTLIAGRGQPERPFHGHKNVLRQRCEYLKKWFDNPVTRQESVVRLDMTWQSLLTLTRYCYTADIILSRLHLYDMIRDAFQYQVYDITFAIGSLLSVGAVFAIMQYADETGDAGLVDMCEQFVAGHLQEFLIRENFVDLTTYGMKRILSDELLSLPENKLWDLTMDWVKAEMDRQKCGSHSHKEMRKLMTPFLSLIRFPVMLVRDFVAGPVSSLILTPAEVKDVLCHLILSKRSALFNMHLRSGQSVAVWGTPATQRKRMKKKK